MARSVTEALVTYLWKAYFREPLQVTLVQDLRNNKAEVEFPSVISQAGDSKISLAGSLSVFF